MTCTYFLGANSARGFSSLYNTFPPQGSFLHIIKGGPGTGKSGFMRAIGAEAERRGMNVEYVLCSGDPSSLDGVYIPALNTAWADGTAPHALDPEIFGVTADYVNLGRFCRMPFTGESVNTIVDITRRYRAMYAEGYKYIAAAGQLRQISEYSLSPLAKRLDIIMRRCRPEGSHTERRIFLRAISCEGIISLADRLTGYDEAYVFTSGFGGDICALELVRREAARRGLAVITAMSPLMPEQIDAILLPGTGTAFFSSEYSIEAARHIRLDSMLTSRPDAASIAGRRNAAAIADKLLALAVGRLRAAKALHDELELQYRPYMDFPALTEFTNEELRRTFNEI